MTSLILSTVLVSVLGVGLFQSDATNGDDFFDLSLRAAKPGGSTDAGDSTAGDGPSGADSGATVYWVPACTAGAGTDRLSPSEGCGATVPCGDDGTAGTSYRIVGDRHVNLGAGCIEPSDPTGTAAVSAPVITPEMILNAFRRVPLPESAVVVQPPGGETLVNFDTVFSTTATTESASLSLLGQSLEFEASPSSFEWHHGDGSTQTTDWPGRSFAESLAMDELISHRYADAHVTVEPRVDTTWSGRFRLNGGPWLPVPGTVTIEGDPSSLRVVEGQPNLVG